MNEFIINTDGGARGNPGPAGTGFIIVDSEGNALIEVAKEIGVATNNQAEYWALVFALEWLEGNVPAGSKLTFKLDSKLIVEQLKGNYKVKNQGLLPLFTRVKELIDKVKPTQYSFTHVPRRYNKRADELANMAMDKQENER